MAQYKKWLYGSTSIIAIILRFEVLNVPTLLPTQLEPKLVTQPLSTIVDYRGLETFMHYFRVKTGYYGAVQKVALRVIFDHCNNLTFGSSECADPFANSIGTQTRYPTSINYSGQSRT